MDISPGLLTDVLKITVGVAGILAFALVLWATARDARRRGKSPLLVILLVLISFPLGLIVWLLFRPEPLETEGPPFRLKNYRAQ